MPAADPSTLSANFSISPSCGFLPDPDPLKEPHTEASEPFHRLTAICREIPKRLLTGTLRSAIDPLAPETFAPILQDVHADEPMLRLAMSQFSFLAHAYIWGGESPANRLPVVLAKPWAEIASRLGRPPILSYASYCLDNWYRPDPDRAVALDNVALIHNFLGGVDEDWFVTIHVCIEAAAAPALTAAAALVEASRAGTPETDELRGHLTQIASALRAANAVFARMPERCDPYIYYHRVRPFIFGSKDNPLLPDGLIYEGAFDDAPQFFRGETGAQSALIPSLDGALGVRHSEDDLRHYLTEMRDYMPPRHRAFIETLERESNVRACVEQMPALGAPYDACLEEIRSFRALHLDYAARYIQSQSQKQSHVGTGGPTETGTGGTPFVPYLRKHKEETQAQKVSGS